jgi:hypothetical protein
MELKKPKRHQSSGDVPFDSRTSFTTLLVVTLAAASTGLTAGLLILDANPGSPPTPGDPGHPGVGPVLAALFVAEIGDVHRFASAPQLCSWAGLTPRHRQSDTTVRRGPITKQGPRLVRWAAVEATQRLPGGSKQAAWFHRIADRRGKGIGRVAAARKLLRLVYYGLRDGQVRSWSRRRWRRDERLGRNRSGARVCHDPRVAWSPA